MEPQITMDSEEYKLLCEEFGSKLEANGIPKDIYEDYTLLPPDLMKEFYEMTPKFTPTLYEIFQKVGYRIENIHSIEIRNDQNEISLKTKFEGTKLNIEGKEHEITTIESFMNFIGIAKENWIKNGYGNIYIHGIRITSTIIEYIFTTLSHFLKNKFKCQGILSMVSSKRLIGGKWVIRFFARDPNILLLLQEYKNKYAQYAEIIDFEYIGPPLGVIDSTSNELDLIVEHIGNH